MPENPQNMPLLGVMPSHIRGGYLVAKRPSRTGTRFYRFLIALTFSIGLFGYPGILNVSNALNVDSRDVTIPFRLAFLGLAAFSLLGSRRFKTLKIRSSFFVLILIFLIFYTVRILADTMVFRVPYLRRTCSIYLGSLYIICVFPAIAFAIDVDAKTTKKMFNASLLVGIFVAISLAFFYRGFIGTHFGRLKGFGGEIGPIIISKYGCATLLMGIYGFLTPKLHFTYTFSLCVLAMVGGFLMMILGGSRGPVLAMAVALCFLSAARLKGKARIRVIGGIILVTLSFPFLIDTIAESGSRLVDRLLRIGEQVEYGGSEASRLLIWSTYLSELVTSPLWGVGIEATLVGIGHNLILDSWYNTGALGGIPFAIVYIAAGLKAVKIVMSDEFAGWVALYHVYFATHCMVSDAIYLAASWWFSLFFVLAYPAKKLKRTTTVGATARAV